MLGIAIFVRHHAKGVTLTPAGQRLIQGARLLLQHAEEFSKTAESLSDVERGDITVGCFPTLAARFMPSLMLEFSERHPMIALHLEEGDHEQLMRDLAQGRIEMAITFGDHVPAGFDTAPLLPLSPVAVLPANHRLARANDVSLTELEKEPLIVYDKVNYVLSLFEALGLEPNVALRLKSFELISRTCRARARLRDRYDRPADHDDLRWRSRHYQADPRQASASPGRGCDARLAARAACRENICRLHGGCAAARPYQRRQARCLRGVSGLARIAMASLQAPARRLLAQGQHFADQHRRLRMAALREAHRLPRI